jgi:hypothetical protein
LLAERNNELENRDSQIAVQDNYIAEVENLITELLAKLESKALPTDLEYVKSKLTETIDDANLSRILNNIWNGNGKNKSCLL